MIYTASGIIPTDGSLAEFGRGPWQTLDDYFTAIPKAYRQKGAQFLVEIPGGYEEYRLTGGVDKIHALLVSTISYQHVSFWISPPVDIKVDSLPGTPEEGYRVLHNSIIKQYETGIWVDKYGGGGIALQVGMAVIVNKVTIDDVDYVNQIYVYEETATEGVFSWERKTDTLAPNWDMFYTIYQNNKRRVRDLTVAPDIVLDVRNVHNSGVYVINTSISNLPAGIPTDQKAFLWVNFLNETMIQYILSLSDNMYIQIKMNNVYGDWIEWKGNQGEPGKNPEFGFSETHFQYRLDGEINWTNIIEREAFKGDIGPEGLSAYEVAVINGFQGTEQEWLETLQGGNTPIIFSSTVPVQEVDGSPLVPGISRWVDTTTFNEYSYYYNGGNYIWVQLSRSELEYTAEFYNYFETLWYTQSVEDALISDVGDNILITNKDFSTDYIPSTSTALFTVNGVAYSVSDLIDVDYNNMLIKYDNESPHHIRAIGVLKSEFIDNLTQAQLDELHQIFDLWLYWSGVWNDYGVMKANRVIEADPIPVTAEYSYTDISVQGANDGTITFSNASGGGGTYEYSIDNGTTWQASVEFTGLAEGTYNLRVRDAANTTNDVLLTTIELVVIPPDYDSFIMTVDTELVGLTPSNEFELVLLGIENDCTVDWGDGNIDTSVNQTISHVYTTGGVKTIKVKANEGGHFQIRYSNSSDVNKVKTIEQYGTNVWPSMNNLFRGASNLTTINATDAPIFMSGAEGAQEAFRNAGLTGTFSFNGWNLGAMHLWTGNQLRAFLHGTNISAVDFTGATGTARGLRTLRDFIRDIGPVTILGLENMDFSETHNLQDFALGSSIVNYDDFLITIASQAASLASELSFHAGTSQYTSAAQSARDTLTDPLGLNWTIIDGGLVT